MRVAVIDRDSDRGGIASSMRTYLSDSSELVNVDDASETLQQAVASNWVDLIVIIPDGFADDFIDAAATGENPPRVDTVTSYTSGAGSMARMNVSGFLSLTRTALIGSHTTVDSAALAAMAGIDIGDTAGDSSEDGMGGFGEFSNQDMLDMLPAGQIEKPSVGDLFEASKAAAASASDMDANHKVAVIDTASADAESASDMAASRFGNRPSMEIIAGEILSFPKVKTKDIICPKCNSENIRYDIHESRFHCGECSLAWDDKLYALVEFPEESAPFEEEGTGYPAWGSGENGALYVPEEDYIRHTGKSPERDKCYRAVCWPDSQKYMGTKGCEPIQDENGIRDFGTSAYWVPLLLTEEAAERRMDKKKVPVCPECGGTDIDILSDEGVAVCNDCCLEWPYAED